MRFLSKQGQPGQVTKDTTVKWSIQARNQWRQNCGERVRKILNHEDLQEETKTFRDSKGSHQQMIYEQATEIQRLKTQLSKLKAENDHLTPALKETQEHLIALENYTRRENLRFMNIPETVDENCQDIIRFN